VQLRTLYIKSALVAHLEVSQVSELKKVLAATHSNYQLLQIQQLLLRWWWWILQSGYKEARLEFGRLKDNQIQNTKDAANPLL
jgi:hypothetical protein